MPPQVFDYSHYDDVIELELATDEYFLTFPQSTFKQSTRVKVCCRLDTKHDRDAQLVPYEDFWFSNLSSLGCKRYRKLEIKARDNLAILIRNETLTDAQIQALAQALVNLRLELSINHNLIALVRIPDQSMDKLVDNLREQNFLPYKELRRPIRALISLPLETNLGRKETSCFQPRAQSD